MGAAESRFLKIPPGPFYKGVEKEAWNGEGHTVLASVLPFEKGLL
jgi:hypothetical protein